jgi:uncharacterized membrane protein
MQTILILYLVSGLLLIGLSIPLIMQKIKPNGLYGFRVQQTLDNPELWYKTNRYSGKWLLTAGIAIVLVALGFYFIPGISVDAYALACLAVFATVLFAGLILSWRYMKSLMEGK